MDELTKSVQTGLTFNENQNRGRLIEVAMLMKKVVIKLSSEQMKALSALMQMYFMIAQLNQLHDKAEFYLVYTIFESKIRSRMFDLKPSCKLKLDIAQANAMWWMLSNLEISDTAIYENTMRDYIMAEIDHQTV